MFDPKITYSFAVEELIHWSENREVEIAQMKEHAWKLVKQFIPQEYLLSIVEKIEISDNFINYICTYKPLT